jgi:hypothetical protein
MIQFTHLEITGSDQHPLANVFQRHDKPASRLAVILPGLGYNVDMPLLYYTARLMVEHGCDVLQIHPDYQAGAFSSLPKTTRYERMYADAASALRSSTAQRNYQQVVLAGKSIGSISLALLLKRYGGLRQPTAVWITPLFGETVVREAALVFTGPSFYMAGKADSSFDPAALQEIQTKTGAQAWLAENADHSLELPGDPLGSIRLLAEGMQALSTFLDQTL